MTKSTRRSARVVALGLLALLLAGRLSAQRPVFRTGIDIVSVEVTAVDKAGDTAKGLQPADFRVSIDGRVRDVVSVEYVRYEQPADAPSTSGRPDVTSNAEDTSRRNVLIVVDQSTLRLENRGVLDGAKRWIQSLGPSDRVGFVGLPAPGPVVDFSTDHARVLAAFGELRGGIPRPPAPYSTRNVSLWEAFQITERNPQVRAEVIARECPPRDPACPNEIDANAQAIAIDSKEQMRPLIGALRAILRGLTQLPGPKHVVVISSGWPIEERQSVQDMTGLAEDAARADATIHSFVSEQWAQGASQVKLSPRLAADQNLLLSSVESLATATGGRAVRLAGNGEAAFKSLNNALAGYYRLAVRVDRGELESSGKRIELQVSRPGITVTGYRRVVAGSQTASGAPATPSPAPPPSAPESTERDDEPAERGEPSGVSGVEAEEALKEALRSPMAVTALGLSMTSYVQHGDRPGSVQVVVVSDVTRGTDGPASAGAVLFGTNGAPVTGTQRVLMIPAIGSGRVVMVLPDAPPATYVLRLAVSDRDGRIGSVERPVDARWQQPAGVGIATTGLVMLHAPEGSPEPEPVLDAIATSDRLILRLPLSGMPSARDAQVNFELVREDGAAPPVRLAARLGKTGSGGILAEAVAAAGTLRTGRYSVSPIVGSTTLTDFRRTINVADQER